MTAPDGARAECSFCETPDPYHFEGFYICPACARKARLRLKSDDRNDIMAELVLDGYGHYIYTASIGDATAAGRRARLASVQRTLDLIAAV